MRQETFKGHLLIIDDEISYLSSLERELARTFRVQTASSIQEARKAFTARPDVVLLDISLSQSGSGKEGVELLTEFLKIDPDLPVVMHSAYGDIETAVRCMQLGAADFVPKPPDIGELIERLQKAIDKGRLAKRSHELEQRLETIEPTEIVGDSPGIRQVKQMIQMVAEEGNVSVLIRGETGTGKELVARSIHEQGKRKTAPFVPVALVSLSNSLIESELFGHEAGAFTGAAQRRHGYIEAARNGVLFLDEIGDLPPDVQVKLLRFLDQRAFYRIGNSMKPIEVDLQVITATNRDLETAVRESQLRQDLYYRIKNVEIYLPPLRERTTDIPLIATHFLHLLHKQGRTRISNISSEALEALCRYAWPGNVRELRSVVERAVMYAQFHQRETIEQNDLPVELFGQNSLSAADTVLTLPTGTVRLVRELARYELALIESALEQSNEEKTLAGKLLGLNDRFALRRRVLAVSKKFPELLNDFPIIKRLYFS